MVPRVLVDELAQSLDVGLGDPPCRHLWPPVAQSSYALVREPLSNSVDRGPRDPEMRVQLRRRPALREAYDDEESHPMLRVALLRGLPGKVSSLLAW
jgi:hypothetical protein